MIEHYYQNDNIFGENWFSYPNLYRKIVEESDDGDIFVEVGAWKGRSSSFLAVEIANSKKDITLYVVDTWEGSVEHCGMDLSKLYDVFLENMKPVESYYFPLKLTSEDASKKFKDKSLKFVFLDGSHEYEDVKTDIEKWLPKVKSGGILAGHDYYVDTYDWFPGVKQAVNEKLSKCNFETSENCWIYRIPEKNKLRGKYEKIKDKLKNFPSVNFISIEESQDRRDLLYQNFEKCGITNVTPHIYNRYNDDDHMIMSPSIDPSIILHSSGRGPVTSHLKAIREWYENSDESYTFICEDDLSFDSVEYWNFTWGEFFNKLPKDWGCVQLCLVNHNIFHYFKPEVKLRHRCFDDWSGCAYLITRKHAKNLIDNYHSDDSFHLEYKGSDREYRETLESSYWFLLPQIENIIYSQFPNYSIYTFPLFLENAKLFKTTWEEGADNWINRNSYDQILNWWEEKGQNLKLNELILIE